MVSKARHAAAACAAGVPRVHIVNGREDEALLAEVFSNEGIGTLIYANEYEQIRPARKGAPAGRSSFGHGGGPWAGRAGRGH